MQNYLKHYFFVIVVKSPPAVKVCPCIFSI